MAADKKIAPTGAPVGNTNALKYGGDVRPKSLRKHRSRRAADRLRAAKKIMPHLDHPKLRWKGKRWSDLQVVLVAQGIRDEGEVLETGR